MPSELVGANVVVVARQFNPSIFSQLWLIRNDITSEESFTKGCFFSDEVAKIETEQFGLLVIPPQLQFQPRTCSRPDCELIQKVGAIVELLPHTPYTAVGLNFAWQVWPEHGNLHVFSQSLFRVRSSPFYEAFGETEDTLFGAYVSKDVLNCRLRLDVKPVDVPINDQVTHRLLFAFNFQIDLSPEEPIAAIQQHLRQWDHAKEEAARIVDLVQGYREEPL